MYLTPFRSDPVNQGHVIVSESGKSGKPKFVLV